MGECSFWYRPTRVVPDQRPLNGRCCRCCCLSVFSCTVLFVSISQVIGCEDRLRNDLYCVEWGVKLYSNQPRSEGSPHHGRTFSIILSLSSVILIDSSTESCPRLDVVHPGRAWLSSPSCTWHCSLHYLSPGNSLVSSCFYSSFVNNPLICFLYCPRNPQNPQSFHLKGVQTCFFILSESPAFTAVCCYRPH